MAALLFWAWLCLLYNKFLFLSFLLKLHEIYNFSSQLYCSFGGGIGEGRKELRVAGWKQHSLNAEEYSS